MIKYGILENGYGYSPLKKYWCGGFDLSLIEKKYWEKVKGIVVSHDINAAYRYRNELATIWPILTYSVEEYDD